jgi:putative peptide zinc metalloprotease protein
MFLRQKIDFIKPYSETDLQNSPFSSRFGGEVATEVKGERQQDAPVEAQYDCVINVTSDGHEIPLGMTGRVAVF